MGHRSALSAGIAALAIAAPAHAQSLAGSTSPSHSDALVSAAFNPAPSLARGVLKPAEITAGVDPAHPLQPQAFAPGKGPVRWSGEAVTLPAVGGAVDTVRLAVGETQAAPIASAMNRGPYRAEAFDLSYTRDWPDAVHFAAGRYDLALSPHAGVGLSSAGTTAQAGAMLRVEPGRPDKQDRLEALGVRDGKAYGEEGRWYLFAAASGRAVGLNMTRSDGGGWNQDGWSTDRTSKLIGDGQLGLGFRKGAMQAAFGYVYREIKVQNGPHGADHDVSDSMAAFSLSIRPDF